MKYFFILLLFTLTVFSQAADETKKPAVSDKARSDFWKATALVTQADAAKQSADATKRAAIEALTKECGDWNLMQDPQTFEPYCAEKPKPAPAPATDKK